MMLVTWTVWALLCGGAIQLYGSYTSLIVLLDTAYGSVTGSVDWHGPLACGQRKSCLLSIQIWGPVGVLSAAL